VASTVEKGHGRLERRTLRTTSALTLHGKWKGLEQGFELRRERTVRGETTVEVVYGITSLDEGRAGAAELLALVRDHWRIENCLHYVRDVALREDACRVRSGNAPQVLAALRNAAVHLISGVAAAEGQWRESVCRSHQANLSRPLELIGLPRLE
jgi:hypothetical protein